MLKNSKFNVYVNSCIANTLTGALIQLNEHEYEAVKNNLHSTLSNESINELYAEGILVHHELDEIALLRHTYLHCKYEGTVSRITICPTLECNFSCPYCYEVRQKGVMGKDVQNKILSFIETLLTGHIKKIVITWYGGEPLLYPAIQCQRLFLAPNVVRQRVKNQSKTIERTVAGRMKRPAAFLFSLHYKKRSSNHDRDLLTKDAQKYHGLSMCPVDSYVRYKLAANRMDQFYSQKNSKKEETE